MQAHNPPQDRQARRHSQGLGWPRPWALALVCGNAVSLAAPPAGPSFDCAAVADGSVAKMVCDDPALAALDREMAAAYKQARKHAARQHPSALKAEQRGWIKGRDECRTGTDPRLCVEQAYRQRTAELQAKYRLVASRGPFNFACEGDPSNKVVVTFYTTDPPTLIAEHGDAVSLMFQQPSGSGARYAGRNESFWEHQGEAMAVWGAGATEVRCKILR